MKNVIKSLRNHILETILAPLFKMLEAIFELLVPLVVASLIDRGIRQEDVQYIWKMCAFLLAFTLLGFLLSITAQYFSAKAAMSVGTTLRSQVFRKIQYMSFTQLDQVGTSTLVNHIVGDTNMVQTGVNLFLRLFLRAPFIVIGATVMAFRIDRGIALIFVVVTLLIITIVLLIIKVTVSSYKKAQERLDILALLTRENHAGARLVRAFGREDDEIREFEENNQTYTKLQVFAGRISAFMNPSTFVLMNVAIILVLYSMAPKVNAGALTQGQIIALVNYLMQILLAIIVLANLIIAIAKAVASAVRLEKILELPSERDVSKRVVKNTEKNTRQEDIKPNVITFKNVDFKYDGASELQLKDLNFSIIKGSTIGIIGGTGAGKSTLVNLIPKFYTANAGQICIDGVDMEEIPIETLRNKIGIVPQYAVLCKGTLRDNLQWGKESATDEEMLRALETAQARTIVEQCPQGLDMEIEQGGKNLSGGQRQRICIARALVRQPEVLILDDSGSALDYLTESKLREKLRENTKDTTVMIVSQRISSIKSADCIFVLDEGEIVGEGTHTTLLEENAVYREIYDSQRELGATGRVNI